jgi:CHASE3 domain sensor protein
MWEKDVIRDEERYARKGSVASTRAENEINDTVSYFEDCASDTVSQIQQTLNNLDEHCNIRLEQMAAEEKKAADLSARW